MSSFTRQILLVGCVAAGLFAATAAQAAFDTFLVFTGGDAPAAQGESQDQQFPNAIEVFSFSLGASNPTTIGGGAGGGISAGKVSISSFNLMKKLDSASPNLFAAAASGKHYDEAKVYMRKAGAGGGVVFLTYTFKQVYVESIQWSGSSGGDDRPTESVSLAFGQISIEYKVFDSQGVPGAVYSANYNLSAAIP